MTGRGSPSGGLPVALAVALAVALQLWPAHAHAQVRYDEGRHTIGGVQLLQDYNDPSAYYYLPQFPRLATNADGAFELLCMKYVDAAGDASGGLFHALIEFTLPPEIIDSLQDDLEEISPGARIVGPVPLMQSMEDGEEGTGSFEIVSAVLSNAGEGGFTRSVVQTGTAPLTPGSKAVVAAILEPRGATLLWDSFTGPTSDVSVAIHAYYEAAVRGYNARVVADVSTVYEHYSRISNLQEGFTRRQMRRVADELVQNSALEIEVLDRTSALGIDAGDMQGILDLVTEKLTELMFDYQAGWAREPEREVAVEADQILGRQERGWFDEIFGGADDTPYYSDDQWVLKRREDIQQRRFVLNLSQATTIRVPLDTAGNLGGLYSELGEDARYFRVVNLEDPAFETHEVHFQVDGAYAEAFQDTLNFVSVNFRKRYEHRPDVTRSLTFTHEDIVAGRTTQTLAFPRLGDSGADWKEFEYQVRWSLRDGPTISMPAGDDEWVRAADAAVSLSPPLRKRVIEIDADRTLFAEAGVASAVVELLGVVAGEAQVARRLTLRASDAEPTTRVAVYHDREEPVAYRVTWYSADHGPRRGELTLLDSDYLFLVPPATGETR